MNSILMYKHYLFRRGGGRRGGGVYGKGEKGKAWLEFVDIKSQPHDEMTTFILGRRNSQASLVKWYNTRLPRGRPKMNVVILGRCKTW